MRGSRQDRITSAIRTFLSGLRIASCPSFARQTATVGTLTPTPPVESTPCKQFLLTAPIAATRHAEETERPARLIISPNKKGA